MKRSNIEIPTIVIAETDRSVIELYQLGIFPPRSRLRIVGNSAHLQEAILRPPLPNLLVADELLMDGLTTIKVLRRMKEGQLPSISTVIVSGWDDYRGDNQRFKITPEEFSMVKAVIAKPFDYFELEGIIRRSLQ